VTTFEARGCAAMAAAVTAAQIVKARMRVGEDVQGPIMGGCKPSRLPQRLEPLSDLLASYDRLMGILAPVILVFVLAELLAGHDPPFSRPHSSSMCR
jgi:hypothetical protein